MDGPAFVPDDVLDSLPPPPPRLFERLRQIACYTWDENLPPFHSSYDFWHIYGTRTVTPTIPPSGSSHNTSGPSSVSKLQSGRPTPSDHGGHLSSYSYGFGSESPASPLPASHPPLPLSSPSTELPFVEQRVVARVSHHALREERAFQIAKSVSSTADPAGDHIAQPLDLFRLNPLPGDRGPIVVAIYVDFGENHLQDVVDMGPAYYYARKEGDTFRSFYPESRLQPPLSLESFLDFAIGATQCLEILHHSRGMVHGEIRGDAFHFNLEQGKVRIIAFGSGVRSFEHGLTSTGWSMLSKELGAKNKLLYISPEQTGRMPAEPDSRTDIYSLGVLFWTLLTQQPVFGGDTALDIVQGVLGRRIANVATIRIDVPDVIGRIIQKCTAKTVAERYHSVSGLRHDLVKVQEHLGNGDLAILKDFSIGSHDVSSFFMLPIAMIGRGEEKKDLLKVIFRVAKTYSLQGLPWPNRFSDGSSLSTEINAMDDISSEGGASSVDGTNRRSGSVAQTVSSETRQTRNSMHHSIASETQTTSSETASSTQSLTPFSRPAKQWERHHSLCLDSVSLVEGLGNDGSRNGLEPGAATLSRQLGSAKFRRHDHCEVVIVEGAGGLGKSLLVQSVLADARRCGYSATAKFDTAKKTPFGPLLKLLSSFFQQVWGERNTDTLFHQRLKQYVLPVWHMLHRVLGLPEFLFGTSDTALPQSTPIAQGSSVSRKEVIRPGFMRRESSPGDSPSPAHRNISGITTQTPQEYLRAGVTTGSLRLVNTILDVLRVFASHKFICFCLEDLHFADDESLELITQIIASRMKMVIIVTYRPEEMAADKIQRVVQPPEADGKYGLPPRAASAANSTAEFPRSARTVITKIKLNPLSEEEILDYVSTTLCRPKEEVLSLALVIQSKTAGNPFYMREMLSACHRKKCIWYDYRDSQWHYDLDRLFAQFQGEKDYDVLDTAFITQRLSELPDASRAVLAWAALLGSSFSFELLSRLMSGEFEYDDDDDEYLDDGDDDDGHNDDDDDDDDDDKDEEDDDDDDEDAETDADIPCTKTSPQRGYSEQEAVSGLQAAIQAYIIVQTESDDRFRFAHDRYIHAASNLRECNARKMHFIISQTLLKYYAVEARQRDSTASHICAAVDIIKQRVPQRREFRKLLTECAQAAIESGARPTAAKYYNAAVSLLQNKPWDDDVEDASYDETSQLYLRSSECYVYMGQLSLANELLSVIFSSARSAIDRAPAYVLQSRIFAQNGNSLAAVLSLKECLAAFNMTIDEEPTIEKCDQKFHSLVARIQKMDREAIIQPQKSTDPFICSIGVVLAETTSAAWWSDCLNFYHLALVMLDMHLSSGMFAQSGMAFLHFAIIALSRFNMVQFAIDMGMISQDLLFQARDAFTMARGQMLYSWFIGHVHCSGPLLVSQTEDAIELASAAGDRMSTILAYGLTAQNKFLASENCADLETFCMFGCDEIPNWYCDTRGGAAIIAVRQVCRALQGKTHTDDAIRIMTDEDHDSADYKSWLKTQTHESNRSSLMYEGFELIPLFIYGYHDRAVEIGEKCYEQLPKLWSARNRMLILFFYGLSLSGRFMRRMQDPFTTSDDLVSEKKPVVEKLNGFIKHMTDWGAVSDKNYLTWTRLLAAQRAELSADDGTAIQHYEAALDHATEHDCIFEEALGNFLMAGFFIRHKARRSARAALLESVGLFRQLSATGVALAIEEEHHTLFAARSRRVADVGIQTDFVTDAPSIQYRPMDGGDEDELTQVPSQIPNTALTEMKGERIGAWRGSMQMQSEDGTGLPALDMIDLHALLVSSQAISSLLQIDELLTTMCDIILQTCGGSGTLAAIIVHDVAPEGWYLAASGDPEKGASAHKPGISLAGTDLVAENVVLYCTRFHATVFLQDIVSDERFGNVSESWLKRNPASRAIIALPIRNADKPLLGVLYLEGEAGSFTDRNVSVLQLLVNQISISYSNALSMKNVEKISAENRSMVAIQQRSLKKALEAETKAKTAEAEAKRNVKLAEEAAKAKSIFLANVSHELRTPLNGVIGNSELLRDSNLSREQLEMADSIRVSADLLLTVINDILDFSKMEADKMKLYIIAFNPEEMVREVVRAVSYSNREKTSKKNVKIIQDIKLPSMLIYGDPIRLHQVLGNLIGNSLKFTEDGSITIGARLDAETKEKATLTFWVRDTGIGIPPQQLAKLFQPFSQADASTARKYGGSGLGLSICKSLIEIMMHGRIELESEETIGTTAWFTVSFEKAKPDVAAGDAQSSSSPPIDRYSIKATPTERASSPNPYLDLSRVPKKDIRICVAEDNPINQKIAIQYVQRLGYTSVSAYENGQKAIEGLRQKAREGKPYHVILMDVQMPVLDGYEATKLIRRDPIEDVRNILVIAMTASAIQGDREKCLEAGMNDYLAKPVRSEVLKRKLDAYMNTTMESSGSGRSSASISPTSDANGHGEMVAPIPKMLPSPRNLLPSSNSLSDHASRNPFSTHMATDLMHQSGAFERGSHIYHSDGLEKAAAGLFTEPAILNPTAPGVSSEQEILNAGFRRGSLSSQRNQPRRFSKSRATSDSVSESPSSEKLKGFIIEEAVE